MKLKILSTGLILLAAIACTEEIKVEPFTYTQILAGETSKSWSIRSLQFFRDGKADIGLGLDDCEFDDIYTFYNNGERLMVIVEGATKCSADSPTIIAESNWSFTNATSTFTFFMPLFGGSVPFTLTQVDETKFSIEIYRDDVSGYRFNFKSVKGE